MEESNSHTPPDSAGDLSTATTTPVPVHRELHTNQTQQTHQNPQLIPQNLDDITTTDESKIAGGGDPLAAYSSTLSASSSLSGSTHHIGHSPPLSSTRFKHYVKPTVLDSPELVFLCQKYIDEKNTEGLARIARNRGLPPAYRQYAWPLLLSSHPNVVNPSIVREYPVNSQNEQQKDHQAVLRRIRGELKRIRQKKCGHHSSDTTNNGNNGTSSNHSNGTTTTNGGTTASSSTIISQTNTGSTSPTNISNSSGSGGGFTNGEVGDAISEYLYAKMEDQRFEILEDAIVKFLQKWGDSIPYETEMAWSAFNLSEWVNPVSGLARAAAENSANSTTTNTSSGSTSGGTSSSQCSTPDLLTPLNTWKGEDITSFDKLFEQLMLLFFCSPAPQSDGPYGPCDSPVTDRISEFLAAFRRTDPELAKHFDEEDVWSVLGGDEWLLYWIKWVGCRVWKSEDRARFWDMYLGWRPHKDQNGTISNHSISNELEQEQLAGIGPDPFWNAVKLDSDEIVNWRVQHMFVCVAMIRSYKNVFFELDLSEARQMLMNFAKMTDIESIVSEAGEQWRAWHWMEEHDDEYDDDESGMNNGPSASIL